MGERVKVVKRKTVRWWKGLRPVRGGWEVEESDLWEKEKEVEARRRSDAEAGRTTTTGNEEEDRKVADEDKIGRKRRLRLEKKKKTGENMIAPYIKHHCQLEGGERCNVSTFNKQTPA